MTTKEEARKGATNVQDGEYNPNDLVKFVDFKAPRIDLYTTEAVIKHYPKVGTLVSLQKDKAAKWLEKGWATTEVPVKTEKTPKK